MHRQLQAEYQGLLEVCLYSEQEAVSEGLWDSATVKTPSFPLYIIRSEFTHIIKQDRP